MAKSQPPKLNLKTAKPQDLLLKRVLQGESKTDKVVEMLEAERLKSSAEDLIHRPLLTWHDENTRETLLHLAASNLNVTLLQYLLRQVDRRDMLSKTSARAVGERYTFLDYILLSRKPAYKPNFSFDPHEPKAAADLSKKRVEAATFAIAVMTDERFDKTDVEQAAQILLNPKIHHEEQELRADRSNVAAIEAVEQQRCVNMKYLVDSAERVGPLRVLIALIGCNQVIRAKHFLCDATGKLIADEATIRNLVALGLSPNVDLPTGRTLFQEIFVQHGPCAMTDHLLQHRADPNLELKDGGTLLHSAAFTGSLQTVNYLLRHRANPNSIDSVSGGTPMFRAAYCGDIGVVVALRDAGGRISNAQNKIESKRGGTELHRAVESEKPEMVDLFIAFGVDTTDATYSPKITRLQKDHINIQEHGYSAFGLACLRVMEAQATDNFQKSKLRDDLAEKVIAQSVPGFTIRGNEELYKQVLGVYEEILLGDQGYKALTTLAQMPDDNATRALTMIFSLGIRERTYDFGARNDVQLADYCRANRHIANVYSEFRESQLARMKRSTTFVDPSRVITFVAPAPASPLQGDGHDQSQSTA